MKIGDRCFVHGYVDEIRKDTIIIRNNGGYFGTDPGEVITVNDTAHPNWIPCSERLPEYGQSVLTYDGHCFCVEKRIPYITDDEGEHLLSDWWVSDDFNEEEDEYYPNLRDGACIAWMPLPEPYEGEARNDGQTG